MPVIIMKTSQVHDNETLGFCSKLFKDLSTRSSSDGDLTWWKLDIHWFQDERSLWCVDRHLAG